MTLKSLNFSTVTLFFRHLLLGCNVNKNLKIQKIGNRTFTQVAQLVRRNELTDVRAQTKFHIF